MDNGNNIRIIKEYNSFKLQDSFATTEKCKIKTVYNSLGIKEWVQRIEFFDSDLAESISMDLYGIKELTKVFSLNEKEFGDEFINLCSLFALNFKAQIKLHAYLCVENEERLASIALKKSSDGMFYVCVFVIDSGDSRRDSIIYIQGIWKTTPLELFAIKIF